MQIFKVARHNFRQDHCSVISVSTFRLHTEHTTTQLWLVALWFDPELNFKPHLKEVTKIALYHLQNIAKIRQILSFGNAQILSVLTH